MSKATRATRRTYVNARLRTHGTEAGERRRFMLTELDQPRGSVGCRHAYRATRR
jgi:hypothetical protein